MNTVAAESVAPKLSVALTSRFDLTQPGGIESAVRVISDRLARAKPNWDIRTVHAFGRQTRWNQIPFAGDLVAALLLAYRCRKADVVLVNGAEYAWPRTLLSRARNRTIVVWHGTRVGEIPALVERMTFPIRVYLRLETWLQRAALSAKRQIAVSVSTIGELRGAYGRIPHVALVPNGAPERNCVRLQDPQPHRVAWIGTTPYKKGLDIAIDACRLARGTYPRLRLVVIGLEATGGEREPWIEFAGAVDHATAMANLDCSSVLLGTSRYEGCSMAIIEAMARGLPVVGGPTVAWMIEDAGIAVEDYRPASFAAALERLLADDELRNRLAKAGPERASRFDWTIATAAYVREIEACL